MNESTLLKDFTSIGLHQKAGEQADHTKSRRYSSEFNLEFETTL
jgi:hypothetical protein